MKHNYLCNVPLEEAKTKYFNFIKEKGFTYKEEKIEVKNAGGRILTSAQYAVICSPHYNASAMDGISVLADDTYNATEKSPLVLTKDKYSIVDTGDLIPIEHNSVIMVEDVIEKDDQISIIAPSYPWQNIRQVGEDICMGDMIAPSLSKITPYIAGALLAGGITTVDVIKKPKVGIIPTGDEIVKPSSNPKQGEIIEFNSTIFTSMLNEIGCECVVYNIVKDKKEQIKNAIINAKNECDIVLVSAGSSAGRDDYTSEVISDIGEVLIHGIAIKPGKPAILGVVDKTPVIGLPGYPVSAIVIMDEIVSMVVDIYYNRPFIEKETVKAKLSKTIVSSLKYCEFVKVSLGYVGGIISATPLNRGAGVITSFTKADGIIVIPQNCEGLESGNEVEVRLLKNIEEIKNSLIITGSHDPLIDDIADMMTNISVKSTHVGSLGGIFAIRSGLAHLGAIHLLDEENGEYNTKYIQKYFPNGGVKLIKGVYRQQGLIVQKGNPENIQTIKDLIGKPYANRQKGSGTRVLFDYLLKNNKISKDFIIGYNNESYTHTAVAALVASGNAVAGMGIYSAAKMYGLDFIPICNEEYDFLVDERFIKDERVITFFNTLKSSKMKERLLSLGGYELYGTDSHQF